MKKSSSNALALPSLAGELEVDMLVHVIVKRRYLVVQVYGGLGYAFPHLQDSESLPWVHESIVKVAQHKTYFDGFVLYRLSLHYRG